MNRFPCFAFKLNLRRSTEVSGEFANMLRTRVLSADLIWKEILTSEASKKVFAEILERKTLEQVRKAGRYCFTPG
jgi:hypothetical protein